MKGHIRERSNGHWAIVIDVRDPETGKRRRKWHSFKGTKREAQVECSRLISEISGGAYIEPAKTTVGQFLDRWLEHMKTQVAPRTHERYSELARKSIAPLLGNVVLPKLQPARISGAYAKALAEGRRDGKGGLSPRTVGHMHRVLRQAMQQAVRWQVLARNPADAVRPPKVERSRMRALDPSETAALLDALKSTRLFMPVLLAITTGMRRGEITAMRWRAVDLVECTAGSHCKRRANGIGSAREGNQKRSCTNSKFNGPRRSKSCAATRLNRRRNCYGLESGRLTICMSSRRSMGNR